jgi:hypothetical protein
VEVWRVGLYASLGKARQGNKLGKKKKNGGSTVASVEVGKTKRESD